MPASPVLGNSLAPNPTYLPKSSLVVFPGAFCVQWASSFVVKLCVLHCAKLSPSVR